MSLPIPSRLNILFVGPLPPARGGSSKMCSQLLRRLVDLGHSVRALASITPAELASGDVFADAHPEIAIERYILPYFDSFPNAAPVAYRQLEGERLAEKLEGMIAREQPDIVVIGREILAWHVPDIAILHSLPCVILIHGGPTTLIVNEEYPSNDAEDFLGQLAKCDLIIPVARHWEKSLRSLGFEQVQAIPNPVDPARFFPREKDGKLLRDLSIMQHQTVVLHASNLQPEKRCMDIVLSAREALRSNPDLLYLMLGSQNGVSVEPLKEVCQRYGIANRFRFVPWVEHCHVPRYMSVADIVVMPSQYETLSMVYLEAQACGKLLLASDIPAAREVIDEGITGLLHRTGDVQQFAAKTLLAAAVPKLRKRIGVAARHAVKSHSLDVVAHHYSVAFQSVWQEKVIKQSL